jgi:hypothetical protein
VTVNYRVERPDVVVGWMQNDYGQLARHAECLAHALVDDGLARRVAYVEPNASPTGAPKLSRDDDCGLHVYRLEGAGVPPQQFAAAVVESSELADPIFLNCGVGEANWELHTGFAPLAGTVALVTHDVLSLWPGTPAPAATIRERIRRRLAGASDVVLGMSEGSMTGLDPTPAVYLGHGCDPLWGEPDVDLVAEPEDLAAIPHPRAVYLGALSVRIDTDAMAAVADAGIEVVLVGFSPSPAVADLVLRHPRVHWLGQRHPSQTPAYLLHCDLALVPHTAEPFTTSMEPHKIYNYAAAGLPSVALNCVVPPQLTGVVEQAVDAAGFAAAAGRAARAGRLTAEQITAARSLNWTDVARRLMRVVRFPEALAVDPAAVAASVVPAGVPHRLAPVG